jgi:hypothetical protein
VKNVRSTPPLRAETQKTRASRNDPMSRFYRVDQFEIIAACLFNATGQWDYRFARAVDLVRMAGSPEYLATMQRIGDGEPWFYSLGDIR